MLAQYGVLDVWTYLAGVVFIILLPGPNSLFVLASGAGRGVRAGYQAALGVFVGDSILMTLTAAGAASVLRLLPMLFVALKAAGAVYLTYLGIRLLMSAWRPAPAQVRTVAGGGQPFSQGPVAQPAQSQGHPVSAVVLRAVRRSRLCASRPVFFILAAILQVCSLLYLSVLIFGGARLAAAFRRRQGLARAGSGLVGLLFLWFAGRMAFEA